MSLDWDSCYLWHFIRLHLFSFAHLSHFPQIRLSCLWVFLNRLLSRRKIFIWIQDTDAHPGQAHHWEVKRDACLHGPVMYPLSPLSWRRETCLHRLNGWPGGVGTQDWCPQWCLVSQDSCDGLVPLLGDTVDTSRMSSSLHFLSIWTSRAVSRLAVPSLCPRSAPLATRSCFVGCLGGVPADHFRVDYRPQIWEWTIPLHPGPCLGCRRLPRGLRGARITEPSLCGRKSLVCGLSCLAGWGLHKRKGSQNHAPTVSLPLAWEPGPREQQLLSACRWHRPL